MGKAFIITTVIVLSIYLTYEGRYYILYFFSLVKNKFSYEKKLNKLMTEKLVEKRLENKDIEKIIDTLIKSLDKIGYKNEKEFVVFEDLRRKLIYSRFDDKSIKILIKEILNHLGLYSENVDLEVKYQNSKIKNAYAGVYDYKLEKIEVFVDPNYSFENIVSIVAHECMHHFLNKKGIIFKDRMQNEFITEMAVIYLGFAKYLLKGYKEKRHVIYESENHRLVDSNKVGYLGYKDVKYAIKYIKKTRKR